MQGQVKETWKAKVKKLKKEVLALYFAYKHNRVSWYARLFIAIVVAYALSPIDLIPDFIPILGYLDDMIILPLGIYLAIKMIPEEVLIEAREKVLLIEGKPINWFAAGVILIIWISVLVACLKVIF